MKRFDAVLLKIFLCGVPVVTVLAVFSYCYNAGYIPHNSGAMILNGFAGLVFAMWMALSVYLSVRLMVSGPFRDLVIARITFIRERDEREAILTGKATRTTLLTSLAFLMLLFWLSCFQISVYKLPPEKAVDGKTGIISLGFGFSLLEQDKQNPPEKDALRKDIFSYRGLPVSGTTLILMMILWQIASYNYLMRRLMKTGNGSLPGTKISSKC